MIERNFIPADKACFEKLEAKLSAVFEPKTIDEICRHGHLKTYVADKILVDIGSSIKYMPVVLSGSIKVMTEDGNGNELLLYYLESGETCAVTLNCCTVEKKSTVRALTETESEILLVPVEKIEEWMIKYQSWRRYILGSYNQRLNEMVSAIDNIVFHSLEKRLIRYLREKVALKKNSVLVISHQDIADDLYTTRVSISRLMRKLEANKLIEQQRNRITVLEEEKHEARRC